MSGTGEVPSSREKTCGLCKKNASKYCCPRCELYLCSLDCYKSDKHTSCSENFYQDCVTQALASQQPDDESKQKMMDILSRMHSHQDEIDEVLDDEDVDHDGEESIDSDDDEASDLHDRIKGLDLNDADAIWNVLTDDEKNGFEAFLNQGEVGTVISQWEPWWTFKKEEKPVEDIDKENIEEEALKKCPALKNVPIFSSLTTVQPSPAIRFNITNVIASYAFITRYFNGDIDPTETTAHLFNICANLDSNANFENYETALEAVVQKCLQSDLIQTDELSLEVMKNDTFTILLGPSKQNKSYYCKAALSHVSNILTEAKNPQKSPSPSTEKFKENNKFSRKFPEYKTEHLPNIDIGKVKRSIKKVDFYLSFIAQFTSYGHDSMELDGDSLSAHLKESKVEKVTDESTVETTT